MEQWSKWMEMQKRPFHIMDFLCRRRRRSRHRLRQFIWLMSFIYVVSVSASVTLLHKA